jgi:hypothetical protein
MFDSIADVLLIQKQNGITRLEWIDGREELPSPRPYGKRALTAAFESLATVLGDDHVLISQESPRSARMEFARQTANSSN